MCATFARLVVLSCCGRGCTCCEIFILNNFLIEGVVTTVNNYVFGCELVGSIFIVEELCTIGTLEVCDVAVYVVACFTFGNLFEVVVVCIKIAISGLAYITFCLSRAGCFAAGMSSFVKLFGAVVALVPVVISVGGPLGLGAVAVCSTRLEGGGACFAAYARIRDSSVLTSCVCPCIINTVYSPKRKKRSVGASSDKKEEKRSQFPRTAAIRACSLSSRSARSRKPSPRNRTVSASRFSCNARRIRSDRP